MDSFSSQADDASTTSGGMYGIAIGGPGVTFRWASNSVPLRHAGRLHVFPILRLPVFDGVASQLAIWSKRETQI